MTKLYIQSTPEVWSLSACYSGSQMIDSGSFITDGYAKLVGLVYAGASSASRGGVKILQSSDYGLTWTYSACTTISACTGCGFSQELYGNAAKIEYYMDATGACPFKTLWRLRPI